MTLPINAFLSKQKANCNSDYRVTSTKVLMKWHTHGTVKPVSNSHYGFASYLGHVRLPETRNFVEKYSCFTQVILCEVEVSTTGTRTSGHSNKG